MADPRRAARAAFTLVLSLVCFNAGCSATSKSKLLSASKAPKEDAGGQTNVTLRPPEAVAKTAPAPATLQPRVEVAWKVDADPAPAGVALAGQSIVGPDGSLPLGPYGTFPVQGLSPTKASENIEKQLAAYLQRPRVTLTPVANPLTPVEWQDSAAPTPAGPALSTPSNPSSRITLRPPEGAHGTPPAPTPIVVPALP